MSMIKYSLKLLKRNFLINLFIAAQIGITLILVIICVSSVMSKIGDYLPIKDILNSDGMCLFAWGDYIESQGGPVYYTVEDIENASENIEKVYSNETIDFLYEPDYEEHIDNMLRFSVYNKNMYDLYKPKMQEGEWLSETKGEREYIVAVASSGSPYNVGDIAVLHDSIDDIDYPFHIIGKTAPDAKYISDSSVNENRDNYTHMYSVAKDNRLFLRRNDIVNTKITTSPRGITFVMYKKGLSKEQTAEIENKIYQMGGTLRLSELNKNSLKYISKDIVLVMPICICVLILSLMCTIASSAISAKNNMKTFLINYICGASLESNAAIAFINSLIVTAVGSLGAAAAFWVIRLSGRGARFCIEFTSYEFKCCVPIILLNILLPVLLTQAIISRRPPKELLTEE